MGSMVVISMQPIGPHLSHFLPAVEDIAINHLGAVALVESLDTDVLRVGQIREASWYPEQLANLRATHTGFREQSRRLFIDACAMVCGRFAAVEAAA